MQVQDTECSELDDRYGVQLSVFRVLQDMSSVTGMQSTNTVVEHRYHVESRDKLAWKARGDVTLLRIRKVVLVEHDAS